MSTDRRDYQLLLATAGLWGMSSSQLNILGVVLHEAGLGDQTIGFVLSSSTVAVMVASVVSGWAITEIGAVRTLLVGAIIGSLAVSSLPFTVAFGPLAALSKCAQGFGFGLIMPAGIRYARSKADVNHRVHFVGMFTAMFIAPGVIGPALGEWSLHHYGRTGFFLLAVGPIIVGLLLAMRLTRDRLRPANTAGYLKLLRDRRIWLPNLAVSQSGLGYGFTISFLPLLLNESGVPVAAFFSPYAAIIVANRFIGLYYLQHMIALPLLVALGLAVYAASFGLLAIFNTTAITAVVAGCLVALGYSIVYPTATEWTARPLPDEESSRPVALIGSFFNCGSIISVQTFGFLLPIWGWRPILILLCVVIGMVLTAVCFCALWEHASSAATRGPLQRRKTSPTKRG